MFGRDCTDLSGYRAGFQSADASSLVVSGTYPVDDEQFDLTGKAEQPTRLWKKGLPHGFGMPGRWQRRSFHKVCSLHL
jgi:hypothetical protein